MFEDWAALMVLPMMGLGFASTYLWFILKPTIADDELRTVEHCWRHVAEELEGTLRLAQEGFSSHTPPTISAIVADVPVTIEARAWREWAYTHNAVEYASRFQTIVTAPSDCPPDLQLVLTVEDCGDREPCLGFWDRFHIVSNNQELSRAWIDDDFVEHASRTRRYFFVLDQGRVVAVTEQLEENEAQLVEVAWAVASLARRGAALLERWQEAADRLGGFVMTRAPVWSPNGRSSVAVERGGCQITIDTALEQLPGEDAPDGIYTRVRARVTDDQTLSYALHGHNVPPFARYFPRVLELDQRLDEQYILRSHRPLDAARSFPPELSDCIADLEPHDITRQGQWVTLRMKGLIDTSQTLEQSVAIAAQLARPNGTGPYR